MVFMQSTQTQCGAPPPRRPKTIMTPLSMDGVADHRLCDTAHTPGAMIRRWALGRLRKSAHSQQRSLTREGELVQRGAKFHRAGSASLTFYLPAPILADFIGDTGTIRCA